jgi:hypothetical protein
MTHSNSEWEYLKQLEKIASSKSRLDSQKKLEFVKSKQSVRVCSRVMEIEIKSAIVIAMEIEREKEKDDTDKVNEPNSCCDNHSRDMFQHTNC